MLSCATRWFYGFDFGETTASIWINEIRQEIDYRHVFVIIIKFLSCMLNRFLFIKTIMHMRGYENTGRLFQTSGCIKTRVVYKCVASLQGIYFQFIYFFLFYIFLCFNAIVCKWEILMWVYCCVRLVDFTGLILEKLRL